MFSLLNNRSVYNLLQSTLTAEKLVKTAKDYGYEAVGICDEEVLFVVPSFLAACKKYEIKPIIGLKIKVEYQKEYLDFCVFAKDDNGYLTLLRFSTLINTKIPLQLDDLIQEKDHLIYCLLPFSSALFTQLAENRVEEVLNILSSINKKLPFYLAILQKNTAFYRQIDNLWRQIGELLSIKAAALPLSQGIKKEDGKLLKVLAAIKLQCELTNPDLAIEDISCLLTIKEMQATFKVEELKNTKEISENCYLTMNFDKASLPKYQGKEKIDSKTFLRSLCQKGLAKRLNNKIPVNYQKRLDEELAIIMKMNYEDYFLLVYDFVMFAKRNQIPTGPGRGSAASSLAAYCLGITHVDPIKYHLLFERFLNPERISMPDIDTDIGDVGRDKVVDYLCEKYGDFRSARILTFGTFKAKQAFRDVAKVYGLSLKTIDTIAKSIPFKINGTLADAYKDSSTFRRYLHDNNLHLEIYETARQIESFPRHLSTHAAGIVLAEKAIYNYVPLTMVGDFLTTQFTMNYLEEYGLIKMDLLGLRNLTIINDIVDQWGLTNPNTWPLDKPQVYKLLSVANTLGVFQLESAGMQATLKKLQPTCFDDIVAIVALYRPGPMQFIDQYLYNRKNPTTIDYGHPDLKPLLEPTFGIMIYQEQILQVAQKIAGFSYGKADILRKAISKKSEKDLLSLKTDFISGCKDQGYDLKTAERIFVLIEKFANYGFNKAHSVGYAMIAYQCAYLKVFYPLAFYQSLLNSVIGMESKLNEYISEVENARITVLLPDINKSGKEFSIEGNSLRFPLVAIKGLGLVAVNTILDIRKKENGFNDFFDFIVKIGGINQVNKICESLVKVGALDSFNETRQTLLAALPVVLAYGSLLQGDNIQESFNFSLLEKPELVKIANDLQANIIYEKELLGIYLSSHPLKELRKKNYELKTIKEVSKYQNSKVVAEIFRLKKHRTKREEDMAFIILKDEDSTLEAAIMPDVYRVIGSDIDIDKKGIFEINNDGRGNYLVKSFKGE